MDQSKSSSAQAPEHQKIPMPRRTFTVEFVVGVFTLAAVACAAYLAVGLANVHVFGDNRYEIIAQFDNVSGLKKGASVEIAGVPVGEVTSIDLDKKNESMADVTLKLYNNVAIRDDDEALVRTKGIIGDRYVKISRGSSTTILKPGSVITQTESVVDIEDLIGKFIHNMDSSKSDSQ